MHPCAQARWIWTTCRPSTTRTSPVMTDLLKGPKATWLVNLRNILSVLVSLGARKMLDQALDPEILVEVHHRDRIIRQVPCLLRTLLVQGRPHRLKNDLRPDPLSILPLMVRLDGASWRRAIPIIPCRQRRRLLRHHPPNLLPLVRLCRLLRHPLVTPGRQPRLARSRPVQRPTFLTSAGELAGIQLWL